MHKSNAVVFICKKTHILTYIHRVRDIEDLAERSRKEREDSAERDKQAVVIQRQLLAEMQSLRTERDALLRALNDANTKNGGGGGNNQAMQNEMQSLRNERDALLRALHSANINATLSPASAARNSAAKNSADTPRSEARGDAAAQPSESTSTPRAQQQADGGHGNKSNGDASAARGGSNMSNSTPMPANNKTNPATGSASPSKSQASATPYIASKPEEISVTPQTDRVALFREKGPHMSDFDFANTSVHEGANATDGGNEAVSDFAGVQRMQSSGPGGTPAHVSDLPSPAKDQEVQPAVSEYLGETHTYIHTYMI
jgi:hypothetical protein